MAVAVIDQNKCDRCVVCAAELGCPIDAVRQNKTGVKPDPVIIDQMKCLGCGICVRFCHSKAIELL